MALGEMIEGESICNVLLVIFESFIVNTSIIWWSVFEKLKIFFPQSTKINLKTHVKGIISKQKI